MSVLNAALKAAVIGLAIAAVLWPSAPPPTAQQTLPGSQWRVVEIDGHTASGVGTVRFTQTSVRGMAACNSFMGAFKEAGGIIEIGGLGVTRMFCQDRMATEQSFLDALTRVRSYRVDGAMLVLLDAAGAAVMKLAD